ncbi:MAG: hypothetical protein ACQETK_11120 [Pseudomonadota bacterium]
MLVLAIAGLPALAAAAGDGHAGHAVHGAQSNGGPDHADHDHESDQIHHGHHGSHSGALHASDHMPAPEHPQASELHVHADCVDGSCLASCSACGHCQGMPSITGMSVLMPLARGMSLQAFQSGPPAAASHRPPILS